MLNPFVEHGNLKKQPTNPNHQVSTPSPRLPSSPPLTLMGYALLVLLAPSSRAYDLRVVQEFVLNAGAFQVPLYRAPPDTNKAFSASCLDDLLHVPCATLLVRIVPAPRSEDGLRTLSRNDMDPSEWQAKGLYVCCVVCAVRGWVVRASRC